MWWGKLERCVMMGAGRCEVSGVEEVRRRREKGGRQFSKGKSGGKGVETGRVDVQGWSGE